VKSFTAPGARQVDAHLERRFEMTNIELWIMNLVTLATLSAMTFYFIRISF
jgi:hypothetical protein